MRMDSFSSSNSSPLISWPDGSETVLDIGVALHSVLEPWRVLPEGEQPGRLALLLTGFLTKVWRSRGRTIQPCVQAVL